ncbi:MAG: VWA domain-containing protein [Chloroflexota bacterium]
MESYKRALWLAAVVMLTLLLLGGTASADDDQEVRERVHVVLVVDNSESMADADPKDLRISAARLFIDLAGLGDEIGLVTMSDAYHTERVLEMSVVDSAASKDIAKKATAQAQKRWIGGTFFGAALKHATNMLDLVPGAALPTPRLPGLAPQEVERKRFIVFLTDGKQEVEPRAALEEAIKGLQERADIRIFPIGLGGGADMSTLEEIANRVGGKTFKANNATELVRIYMQIFSMLRDDRYADFFQVPAGREVSLARIDPAQRIYNVSWVATWPEGQPAIKVLRAPNRMDLVEQERAKLRYRATDPRYDLFTVDSKALPLDGGWNIWVEGPITGTAVNMAAIVRSELRVRLFEPEALAPTDDYSPRYWPQNKRMLVQAGAGVLTEVGRLLLQAGTTGFPLLEEKRTLGMTPEVTMTSPKWEPLGLKDDGYGYDLESDDGYYANVYQPAQNAGRYSLSVEVPARYNSSVHLAKEYTIRVAPLPTLQMTLSPSGKVEPDRPVTATLKIQPGTSPVVAESVEITTTVRRPDGFLDDLMLQRQPDGKTYLATYVPTIDGKYAIMARAHIQAVDQGKKIFYSDFSEEKLEVARGLVVSVTALDASDAGKVDRVKLLRTFRLASNSPKPETIKVEVRGLPGAVVLPNVLRIEPNSSTTAAFTVLSDAPDLPTDGKGSLVFTSLRPEVKVDTGGREFAFTYHLNTIWERLQGLVCFLFLGALLGVFTLLFTAIRSRGERKYG